MSRRAAGIQGYAEDAAALVEKWESLDYRDVHRAVAHLIPRRPAAILDIGAGSGRDAAALAGMGHRVVAVEPVVELRVRGALRHLSPNIEWVGDSLPGLRRLSAFGDRFDVVMMTAVWMHLDERQRRRAMPNVARLVRPGGFVIMSLRHGPSPPGRCMFAVAADETIRLAANAGLAVILNCGAESAQRANRLAGVHWTWVGFAKHKVTGSSCEEASFIGRTNHGQGA